MRQTVPCRSSPLRAVSTCCRDPRPHAEARDGGEATGERIHADRRPVVADQTFWKAPANPWLEVEESFVLPPPWCVSIKAGLG